MVDETKLSRKDLEVSRVFTENNNAFNNKSVRVIVNEGSSRSTKTYSIIQLLIYICTQNKGISITASREKMTWVRLSIFIDFKVIMKEYYQLWDDRCFNKTEMLYTFYNGATFQFMGLDDSSKVHGYKSDILWINEAIQVNEASYKQLVIRTTKKIILDYNPNAEQHWIYDKVITRDDCVFIKSTYQDNPWLEKAIVREIERLEPTPENIEQGTADETLWKIYGLGERAAHKGLIFGDAKIVKKMPDEKDRKKSSYGMDFGFTNDPTALVEVALAHGELWLDQIIYERGLVNRLDPNKPNRPSIEGKLIDNNIPKGSKIWCDSAEPKTIEDLNNAGWYGCEGAKKGPDSIVNGIMAMKRYKINITERSIDLIKERDNWKWKEDATGKATNKPIRGFDHCFTADTLIATNNGDVKIVDINKGDMVLTSNGYRPVLNKFCNGVKITNKYILLTSFGEIAITCTPNHMIKTGSGWQKINSLKKKETIYLHKSLTERCIENTGGQHTLQGVVNFSIGQYGNTVTEISLKDFAYITLILTPIITILKTLKYFVTLGIALFMDKTLKTSHGIKNLEKKALWRRRFGTNQKRAKRGTRNILKKIGIKFLRNIKKHVKCVEKYLSAQRGQNIAIITVTLKAIETEKRQKGLQVYDLAIEGTHEYFANGLLVHNCWDAARYNCIMEVAQVWKEDGRVTFSGYKKKDIRTIEDKIKFLEKRNSRRGNDRSFE